MSPIFHKLFHRRHSNGLIGLLLPIVLLFGCQGSDSTPAVTIVTETNRFLEKYPVLFTAALKSGAHASDYDFFWEFGDDTTGSGPELEHAYLQPGEYVVTLTITGPNGKETDDYTLVVRPSLRLVASHSIDVDSPSGLSLGPGTNVLYTLSDKPSGRVAKIDKQGNVLDRLHYRGSDLEGVCFDSRDSTLWIVEENLGQLIHLDQEGDAMSVQNIAGVSDGGGLEAITLNEAASQIMMFKEKDFGAFITLDQVSLNQELRQMSFAPDFSGLFYHASTGDIWVLSDEASSIYRMDANGVVSDSYSFDMTQPEGLVYDERDSCFYIVDDTEDRLYIYRFWDAQ